MTTMNDCLRRVVIGGGVAGVCCAQELARLHPGSRIILICEGSTIVETSSLFRITEHLEELSVYERSTDSFKFDNPNVEIKHCTVTGVCYEQRLIHTTSESGAEYIEYDQLCIATGVRPKLIANHPNIIGLRDLQSVEDLVKRLSSARRVLVVGNGGIALELIHELTFCEVDWVVKSHYLGSAFFDASASAFIMPSLLTRASNSSCSVDTHNAHSTVGGKLVGASLNAQIQGTPTQETSAAGTTSPTLHTSAPGCGLGPEWLAKSQLRSTLPAHALQSSGCLNIHCEQEVAAISDDNGITWRDVKSDMIIKGTPGISSSDTIYPKKIHPLCVRTTTGEILGCDFLISATGVQPNSAIFTHSTPLHNNTSSTTTTPSTSLSCTEEGYIIVDSCMRTSIDNVFAAGDCCEYPVSSVDVSVNGGVSHFFQMRLWTQARWMGMLAAHSMYNCIDDYAIDTKFELFSHVTRFFGHKVIMLGRYNAQGLGERVEAVTKEFVISDGKLQQVSNTTQWTATDSTNTTTNTATTNTPSDTTSTHPVEIWVRTSSEEYVKLVTLRGRLVGALLIGDTDLEEVCENLILNGLDISGVGVDMLNPDIDIADYFD